MTNTNETIADIIAEMRDWLGDANSYDLRSLADRLEAAWKREKSAIEDDALAVGGIVEASRATAEKSSTVGDAAKLREALKTVKRYFDGYTVNILELRRKVDAALAAPPRNCEVGTAEEQARRFNDYCHKQGNSCSVGRSKGACLMFKGHKVDCAIVWSRSPYEKGGAK